MKFTALAATAAIASAQGGYPPAQGTYDPSIVPENYAMAVHDVDLSIPTISQDFFNNQVDIYSDEIISIEALRIEVLQLTMRVEQAEDDFQIHAAIIADNRQKISENSRATLDNAEAIMALDMDVNDLMMTLQR